MQLKPRDTQTYVKHFILESYLNQWGGIIGHGLRHHGYKMHLVYVDGFAYCGRYAGDHKDLLLEETDTEIIGENQDGLAFETPYKKLLGVTPLELLIPFFNEKNPTGHVLIVLSKFISTKYAEAFGPSPNVVFS